MDRRSTLLAFGAGALATITWTGHALADGAPPMCASAEQAAAVTALYAEGPAPMPFQAAAKLKLTEAVVLSSLGSKRAVGVAGAEFEKVWASLDEWPAALTMIVKDSHIFEIHSDVPSGEPSKRSKFFNLAHGGQALGGHLRPDLVSAIYAIDLVGGEGPVRGIVFLGTDGASSFSVFVPPAEGKDAPPSPSNAPFDKTRALLAAMPQVCAAQP
ncbi:MAG: ChuX/HutX family heme-like substrate-binding protein [Steroidobacteraceae bacterium]